MQYEKKKPNNATRSNIALSQPYIANTDMSNLPQWKYRTTRFLAQTETKHRQESRVQGGKMIDRGSLHNL